MTAHGAERCGLGTVTKSEEEQNEGHANLAALPALALSASAAVAQPATMLRKKLVGTWDFVIAEITMAEGTKNFPFGAAQGHANDLETSQNWSAKEDKMRSLLSDYYFVMLVVVMLIAGGLGGAVNHYFSQEDEKSKSAFGRAVLIGIVAAFMVPLFLNMISSNLLDQIRGNTSTAGDPIRLLVFAGFCLVAAVSSRAFIRTLSDRVLREVAEAKKDAKEAKDTAKDVEAAVTEPPARTETANAKSAGVEVSTPTELSAEEKRVLEAFKRSKYILRTSSGLAADSGLDNAGVEAVLSALEDKGLVEKRLRATGPKWQPTRQGDDVLNVQR